MTNSYNPRDVDESPHILQSLSPLEPRICYQDVRTRLLDDLEDWLSQTEDFINRRDGRDESIMATLFGSGAPGAGKTYLR